MKLRKSLQIAIDEMHSMQIDYVFTGIVFINNRMPVQVLMPALSPTMTKGKLVKWSVKAGDKVDIGTVIAEVETDKATMEIESFEEGTIGKILVEEGTADVAVNSPLSIILLDGETESDMEDILGTNVRHDTVPDKKEEIKEKSDEETKLEVRATKERIKASPLARRIAKEKNIDLEKIKTGSGPYGRIVKADVLDYDEVCGATTEAVIGNSYSEISTIRGVIAERLVESKQSIPHFYLTVECNLDKLAEIRKQINEEGGKITVNDFFVKATALALQDFPEANSSWLGDKIEHYATVDVAVAVSLEEGLITPIIRECNTKSLKAVSSEIKSLAQRAKIGTLSSDEYQGGGITVSNLGMFGIRDFLAIINPPQSSILAVGAAEQRVIVRNGKMKIAVMVTMTLSVDHRVVDGVLAAKFLNKIKSYLENPLSILIS